jgi:hypothetical protein
VLKLLSEAASESFSTWFSGLFDELFSTQRQSLLAGAATRIALICRVLPPILLASAGKSEFRWRDPI